MMEKSPNLYSLLLLILVIFTCLVASSSPKKYEDWEYYDEKKPGMISTICKLFKLFLAKLYQRKKLDDQLVQDITTISSDDEEDIGKLINFSTEYEEYYQRVPKE
jgi:hypothetical protein